MLDIEKIRKEPEKIKIALLKRMDEVDLTELLNWDEKRKILISKSQALRTKKNEVSEQIPSLQDEEKIRCIEKMKKVADEIKILEADISDFELKIKGFMDELPNIPDDDVPAGGKENNEEIREWGSKPDFTFNPKNHVDLATQLGLVDYERGVKMGGKGFWLYKGTGALMEWALLNYFIDEHIKDGYEFVLPPHILNQKCGYTAGQFPKFADDVFHLTADEGKKSDHFLMPTAETALANFYRDEILREDQLPKKLFAYTPCYRKEAGSYRTEERGMIRGHQFNKVELFQYTRPEDSDAALEELIEKAEKLVQGLGLHYRVSKLAAKDCSASMAKTYDIEVWIPSMNEYKEISSASNARDFQARRGKIRFKRKGKIEFVNTLNASGLATSRLLPAILEQFQQKDGSVIVPDVLKNRIGKNLLTDKEER